MFSRKVKLTRVEHEIQFQKTASSEVFRCLSKRTDILDSMLQADHVGFHSYEYARHFLSIAHRMLGLKYGARKGGTFGLATTKVCVLCSFVVCIK